MPRSIYILAGVITVAIASGAAVAALATHARIFVMNVNGPGLRRITPWRLDAGDPDWSPDGRRIVFRSPHEFAGSNLFTVRPDGSRLKQLTRFTRYAEAAAPSYAPDGKWIVFSRNGRSGLRTLFAVRPDGTGMRQVTRTAAGELTPDWGSP